MGSKFNRDHSLHLDDFLSQKCGYTAPGGSLAGYPLRTLAPVSRDESVVRAIQRPGVRP